MKRIEVEVIVLDETSEVSFQNGKVHSKIVLGPLLPAAASQKPAEQAFADFDFSGEMTLTFRRLHPVRDDLVARSFRLILEETDL